MSRGRYAGRHLRIAGALVVGALAGAGLAVAAGAGERPTVAGDAAADAARRRSIVEIRSYNLRPGSRPRFHRLVVEEAAPMLRRREIEVVAHGPSPHDETSYYVIRAFADLNDRQRREDAFYSSLEWRNGPRESILSMIESYTTIVLELDRSTIERLRAGGHAYSDGPDADPVETTR